MSIARSVYSVGRSAVQNSANHYISELHDRYHDDEDRVSFGLIFTEHVKIRYYPTLGRPPKRRPKKNFNINNVMDLVFKNEEDMTLFMLRWS